MRKGYGSEYGDESKRKVPFWQFIIMMLIMFGFVYVMVYHDDIVENGIFGIFGKKTSEMEAASEWDELVLADRLPDKQYEIDYIWDNSRSYLNIDVEMKIKEYYEYVDECKTYGYNIDAYETDHVYTAFDADGYKIELEHKDYIDEITIKVKIPSENSDAALSTESESEEMTAAMKNKEESGTVATQAPIITNEPTPTSEPTPKPTPIANGARDRDGYEDVKNVQLWLIELGYLTGSADGVFGSGTERALKEFQEKNELEVTGVADDDTVYTLESSYAIPKYEVEEVEETEEAEDSDLVDGMRPSVKEAIDSFEEYFTEYCELMEKMEENPNNPLLLVDYAQFLATYDDTMRDLENMEDDDLNDAEMAYYLSAMNRINGMLIDTAYNMN